MFAKYRMHNDSGAVAVEFSLVIPVFLGMVLGIYWVSWTVYSVSSIHSALIVGARALQLKPSTTQTELQSLVRAKVLLGDNAKNITVTLKIDPASGGTQLAHTTATYPVSFTVPLFGTYKTTYSTSMTVVIAAS